MSKGENMSMNKIKEDIPNELFKDFELSELVFKWAMKGLPAVITMEEYEDRYKSKILPYYMLLGLKNGWTHSVPTWLTPDYLLTQKDIAEFIKKKGEIIVDLEVLWTRIQNEDFCADDIDFIKPNIDIIRKNFPFSNIMEMVDIGSKYDLYMG